MRLYGLPIWEIAQDLKSFDFSQTAYSSSVEKGYLLLNYFLSRRFADVHWLLFFFALIESVFVLVVLLKSDLKRFAWLGYLYYLFIFFPRSVNLIRQSLSFAILFVSSYFFLKRKWKPYFLFTTIAFCFHHSSVIAFAWPLMYWYMKGGNNKLKICSLFALGALGIVSFKYWGFVMFYLGDKYSVYMDGTFKPHFTFFSLVNVPFILFFWTFFKSIKQKIDYTIPLLSLLIVGFCCAQMSMISVYLIRISTFFDLFLIWAAMIVWDFSKENILNKNKVTLVRLGLIFYPILFFCGYYIYTGQNNICPYISEIFDQLWTSIL